MALQFIKYILYNINILESRWKILIVTSLFIISIFDYVRGKYYNSNLCVRTARIFFVWYMVVLYIFLVIIRKPSTLLFNIELFWSEKEVLKGNYSVFKQIYRNIIMFVPFGIAGGFIWNNIKKVTIRILLFSFAIEIIQLITKRGLFELDDIFHNTLGGFFGYLIYYVGTFFYKQLRNKIHVNKF